jgi:dTMP kinase
MTMRRGIFITFEGPEGSGKSTHSRLLAGWLRRSGRRVLHTREPGGTVIGGKLRRILLDTKPGAIEAEVELLLYEASRAVLVSEVIRPALKAGKVVILDRFQDSTWVYQGFAGGMDRKLVEHLGRIATGGLQPDRTILLDLPARQGLARVHRPNRMEAKPVSFHEKVRRGYLHLAKTNKKRIRLIRADRPMAQVQETVREAVKSVLR